MARPRTIDRMSLLDAAERVVAGDGVSALSFGSVASAAGLSKASVQSAFGSREALIEAMLERWAMKENSRFETEVGPDASRTERIAAHIRLTATETAEVNSRITTLLAALANSGKQSRSVTTWFSDRLGDLEVGEDLNSDQRIALLAGEGAFFLRHFIGFEFSQEVWNEIYVDLERLAGK